MIFDTCGTCQKEASCSIVVERLLDVYAREVGCVFLLKEIKYPLTDIWYGVHFVISDTNMKKKMQNLIEFLELGKEVPWTT